MTTDTRPVRLRWQGDATAGPLHATVNGAVAGTLIRDAYGPGWTLSPDTLKEYPMLYGIGPAVRDWPARPLNLAREAGNHDPERAAPRPRQGTRPGRHHGHHRSAPARTRTHHPRRGRRGFAVTTSPGV